MANILVVDDIAVMRKKIGTMLMQAGHSIVAEADDGEQAFKEYEKNKPDLVMMDITMPNLDGIGAVKKIIGSYPQAKIIMVSALAQKHMVLLALQCGAKNYIIKPVEYGRLIQVVRKTLEDDTIREDLKSSATGQSKIVKPLDMPAYSVGTPFTVENDKGVFIVRLSDKMDRDNINMLTMAVQGFLVIKPISIVFDFGGLDYLDEQVLHIIVEAYIQIKNQDGSVKLESMGERLTRMLVEKYGHIIALG